MTAATAQDGERRTARAASAKCLLARAIPYTPAAPRCERGRRRLSFDTWEVTISRLGRIKLPISRSGRQIEQEVNQFALCMTPCPCLCLAAFSFMPHYSLPSHPLCPHWRWHPSRCRVYNHQTVWCRGGIGQARNWTGVAGDRASM